MDGKLLARIAAVVFVAVAITATAIETTRKEETPERGSTTRAVPAQVDPLREALIRCQELGEEGPRDPDCRRAWSENRQRFLAPGARPADRLPQIPPRPRADLAPAPTPSTPQPDEAR